MSLTAGRGVVFRFSGLRAVTLAGYRRDCEPAWTERRRSGALRAFTDPGATDTFKGAAHYRNTARSPRGALCMVGTVKPVKKKLLKTTLLVVDKLQYQKPCYN